MVTFLIFLRILIIRAEYNSRRLVVWGVGLLRENERFLKNLFLMLFTFLKFFFLKRVSYLVFDIEFLF